MRFILFTTCLFLFVSCQISFPEIDRILINGTEITDGDFGTHAVGDSISILFSLSDRGEGLTSFFLGEEVGQLVYPLNSYSYGGFLGEAEDEMLLHFVRDTLYEDRITTSNMPFVPGIFSEISVGDTITLIFEIVNEDFRFADFSYKLIVSS